MTRAETVCSGPPPLGVPCEMTKVFDHCEVDPDAPAIIPGITPATSASAAECGPLHHDDTECKFHGSGGGAMVRRPTTCRYHCDGVLHQIILPFGMERCPGESTYKVKWNVIKGFPRKF